MGRANYKRNFLYLTTSDIKGPGPRAGSSVDKAALRAAHISLKIKGPGPRAWAESTPSVCHGALLAPLPVAKNNEVEHKAWLRWGSQFGPSPGPWPLNTHSHELFLIST